MNKAELIEWLTSKHKDTFESKAEADRALGAVIDGIKAGLKKDTKVQLVGFGTFEVKSRKARTGRNPQTGEKLKIPASKTVGFRPGKTLKDSVKGGKRSKK
ncbi:MAG: HU family DNA-binding protein [Planctomycetota bacterium]|jgi:DNA-binding protein HU-beta